MLSQCRSAAVPTRWEIANLSQGLCVPSASPNATFGSLEECQRFARPEHREMRWNVVNSSGYACASGDVAGECRPTLDPYAEYATGTECASSDRARYSAYPNPQREKGWICTNPVLGTCIETQNVDVPFTYKVYATYDECVRAPENNQDSSALTGALEVLPSFDRPRAKWYVDADRGRCDLSYLPSAPFDNPQQCKAALARCGYSGQPALQFSNPVQAPDAHWKEPFSGFWRDESRNVQTYMQPPQIPLNPPDRVPVIGTHQIVPGLAGQGYSVY